MHNIGPQKFMISVWSRNSDCMAKIDDHLLRHLGPIPLFDQVSIVWIKKSLLKNDLLKNLFLVQAFLQGCGFCYSYHFCLHNSVFSSVPKLNHTNNGNSKKISQKPEESNNFLVEPSPPPHTVGSDNACIQIWIISKESS